MLLPLTFLAGFCLHWSKLLWFMSCSSYARKSKQSQLLISWFDLFRGKLVSSAAHCGEVFRYLCRAVKYIFSLCPRRKMTIWNGSNVLYMLWGATAVTLSAAQTEPAKWEKGQRNKKAISTSSAFSHAIHSKQGLGEEVETINCQIGVVKVTGSDTGRRNSYEHKIENNKPKTNVKLSSSTVDLWEELFWKQTVW